jgi:hypothetical protein
LVLVLGSLAPALFAQQQRLDREIGFVRALAREMRFIELAKEEADRLASEFRGAGDQDKIAQLAVEVAYYGARSRGDRTQQRQLFKEAIGRSKRARRWPTPRRSSASSWSRRSTSRGRRIRSASRNSRRKPPPCSVPASRPARRSWTTCGRCGRTPRRTSSTT